MAVKALLMCKRGQIGILLVVAAFVSTQLTAETKVPNEFTSGTPAKASEVNENFAALVEDIQAITEPEKKYSIISSETLESGLVRTKLYAFEEFTYEQYVRFDDKTLTGTFELDVFWDSTGKGVNALGRLEFSGYDQKKLLTSYSPGQWGSSTEDILYAPVTCPDGSQMSRHRNVHFRTRIFRHATGGFVLSSHDSISSGMFEGCSEFDGDYFYLEGRGTGIYSCVTRIAYHGSTGSGEYPSTARAPAGTFSILVPYGTVTTHDRRSNGTWGAAVLEIDAPADCLQL
jgi:hypothetical protein